MTNEPSPRPWHIGESISGTMSCIHDANGEHIASCFGMPTEADAALIVDAVNKHGMPIVELIKAYDAPEVERDRLRDLVRRLLPLAETTVENIRALGTARFPFLEQIKSDRLRGDINREVANADYLLREARAALGEETQE